ncbi:MAG: PDZ domain-containing protein [Planctomycetota bacterium]
MRKNNQTGTIRFANPRITQSLVFNESGKKFEFDQTIILQTCTKTHRVGIIEISNPNRLSEHAVLLAKALGNTLSFVDQELGLKSPFNWHLFLFPLADDYSSVKGTFRVSDVPSQFSFPLFVHEDPPLCPFCMMRSRQTVFAMLHEAFESHLILPQYPPSVLPDFKWNGLKFRHHTRWFRDGLSTYASYCAILNLLKQYPHENDVTSNIIKFNKPLLNLAKVRASLFKWDQFDSSKLNNKMYQASFGLFLLLEHEFGRSVLRAWISDICSCNLPDGEDLIDLFQKRTSTDLRRYVKEFSFPHNTIDVGVSDDRKQLKVTNVASYLTKLIREGDIIVSIQNESIRDRLDYELNMLKHSGQDQLELIIDRKGTHHKFLINPAARRGAEYDMKDADPS